jgi:hypothetical protein
VADGQVSAKREPLPLWRIVFELVVVLIAFGTIVALAMPG